MVHDIKDSQEDGSGVVHGPWVFLLQQYAQLAEQTTDKSVEDIPLDTDLCESLEGGDIPRVRPIIGVRKCGHESRESDVQDQMRLVLRDFSQGSDGFLLQIVTTDRFLLEENFVKVLYEESDFVVLEVVAQGRQAQESLQGGGAERDFLLDNAHKSLAEDVRELVLEFEQGVAETRLRVPRCPCAIYLNSRIEENGQSI